jgi:hypothetical protein
MADTVRVTSIDALERFRAALVRFAAESRQALDETGEDVRRTRSWIQHDRRMFWEGELRRRRKKLDAAEQELLGARISSLRDSTAAQQHAVRRAKGEVAEAEEKLALIKRWGRTFDDRTGELLRRLESMRYILDQHIPKAAAFLAKAVATLDAYTDLSPDPIREDSGPRDASAEGPSQ